MGIHSYFLALVEYMMSHGVLGNIMKCYIFLHTILSMWMRILVPPNNHRDEPAHTSVIHRCGVDRWFPNRESDKDLRYNYWIKYLDQNLYPSCNIPSALRTLGGSSQSTYCRIMLHSSKFMVDKQNCFFFTYIQC